MPAPPDTLGIMARETAREGHCTTVGPHFRFPRTASQVDRRMNGSTPNEPGYSWEVGLRAAIYVSSPTANFNRETARAPKDGYYTLIDLLDASHARLPQDHARNVPAGRSATSLARRVLGFFAMSRIIHRRLALDAQTAQSFRRGRGMI